METPKQSRSNRHETSVEVKFCQTKSEEISSPLKLLYGAPISYFPGTCVNKRFYRNLISKSRSHLIFTVRLSFYLLFLDLIFRNDLLSPKLNHGFSGKNTTFSKKVIKILIIQNIYLSKYIFYHLAILTG